jgi:hypothetical protein
LSDGRIQPGDKLVAANGIECGHLTHQELIQVPIFRVSHHSDFPSFIWICVSGTDVMILQIFSPNFFGENIGVFCSNYCYFLKKMIITLVYEKNANCFAENGQKSQKS